MTRADTRDSTPRRTASKIELPVDPTRRRFLVVAAIGSIAGAGSLAVAAATPANVPQVVTIP